MFGQGLILTRIPKLASANGSGTGILPVSCRRKAAGDFPPDHLPEMAGWKPAPLTTAMPTSEFGFNRQGLLGVLGVEIVEAVESCVWRSLLS
jgi:hypothetical protein